MMSWIPTHVLIVAGVLLSGSAIIWVLQQRRSPQSALAWILFIIMVPYLGVPLFFALGVRKRGARYDLVEFATEAAPPPLHELDDQLRRLGVPPASPGNALTLEPDPAAALASLYALVDGAQTRLDVALYRLDPDPVSRAFVERLTAAAGRGVEVRVILDQFGTWRRPRRALKTLEAAGGDVRLFSALPQLAATGRINLRNHRKMLTADGQTLWTGGRNVGKVYLAPQSDPKTWHDLSFTLEGPVVRRFCELFNADWQKVAPGSACLPLPPPAEAPGSATLQLLPSGPDVGHDALHDALVRAIYAARERVWIVTPYFLPTDQLEHALVTAARLGRDVRILLPARSNQPVADFARGAYLRELDEAGAQILRFEGGMMHAKAFMTDDVAWIGSANLDIRSMLLNFEATLMVYDRVSVAAVVEWIGTLERRCALGARQVRLPRRLAEGVFRLGAPIL